MNKKIPRQEKGGEPAGVLLLNLDRKKEGETCQGVNAIVEYLKSYQVKKVPWQEKGGGNLPGTY